MTILRPAAERVLWRSSPLGTPSDDLQFAGAAGADDGPPPAKKQKGRKGYFNWKRGTFDNTIRSEHEKEDKRQYQSRTLHPSLPLRV
jgi:hypothetical protein